MRDVRFNFDDPNNNPSTSEDNVVGLLVYSTQLPTAYTADNVRVKAFRSVRESVQAGISGIPALAGNSARALEFAQVAYHLRELFRVATALGADNPTVHVGFYNPADETGAYSRVIDLQRAAGGACRAIGIFRGPALTTGGLTDLNTRAESLRVAKMGCMMIPQLDATTTITALPDLSTLALPFVHQPLVGEDGNAEGWALTGQYGKPTGIIGAYLGLICRTNIGNTTMYVRNGDISGGDELDTVVFPGGIKWSELEIASNGSYPQLATLESKRYAFPRKIFGVPGTFINDSLVLNQPTSVLDSLEASELRLHAERRIYRNVIRELGASIPTEANGTLSVVRLGGIKSLALNALRDMSIEGKCSAPTPDDIIIDATQPLAQTKNLQIGGRVRSLRSAKDITFTLALA